MQGSSAFQARLLNRSRHAVGTVLRGKDIGSLSFPPAVFSWGRGEDGSGLFFCLLSFYHPWAWVGGRSVGKKTSLYSSSTAALAIKGEEWGEKKERKKRKAKKKNYLDSQNVEADRVRSHDITRPVSVAVVVFN